MPKVVSAKMTDDEIAKNKSVRRRKNQLYWSVGTVEAAYPCRPRLLLILAGDTEGGDGEFIRIPVLGLTMGIALRIRVAAG
jgi:hypothetical protein